MKTASEPVRHERSTFSGIPAFMLRVSLVAVLLTSSAAAQVTFFVSPGSDPGGDLAFHDHLRWPVLQFDFEDVPNCGDAITMLHGGTRLDIGVRLLDSSEQPTSDRPTMFPPNTLGAPPGTIDGNTMLNGSTPLCGLPRIRRPWIEFEFSPPVLAFGTWVFDDEPFVNHQFVLEVEDANGSEFTSPVLDAGMGDVVSFEVDGFIGAAARVGIVRARVQVQNPDGTVAINQFFELDNVQVSLPGHPASIDGDAGRVELPLTVAEGDVLPGLSSLSCLGTLPLPRIGQTWTIEVDAQSSELAGTSLLRLRRSGTGPVLFTSLLPASGGIDRHRIPIPNDPALVGERLQVQVAVLGDGLRLCDPVEVVVGE